MHYNNKLISILIPVLNSEKYLEECLDSVVNQSNKNIEIVLVDSGSSDRSIEIINKYIKEDERINLFNTNKTGVSAARNLALEKAKGEYILFVDSDDFLSDKDALNKIMNNLEGNDVIRYENNYLSDNKITSNNILESLKDNYKTGLEFLNDVLNKNNEYKWYLWQYVFKKDLWDDIKFPEDKIFEDTFTIYRSLLKANNVKVLKDTIYTYRNNTSGVSRKINYKICEDLIYVIKESSKYVSSLSIREETKQLLLNNFSFNYISIVNALSIVDSSEKDKVKQLLNDNKDILNNCLYGKAKTVKSIINVFGIDFVAFVLKIRRKLIK